MAQKYGVSPAATVAEDITGGGVSADDAGVYLLNICNWGVQAALVRVWITKGGAPGNIDKLEHDALISVNGVLTRWPIPLGSGWKVFFQSSVAGVTAQLIGREED